MFARVAGLFSMATRHPTQSPLIRSQEDGESASRGHNMLELKTFLSKKTLLATALLTFGAVGTIAPAAKAQISINIGVQPVCTWGYYDYAPYACAPSGFYGSGYFYNGIFLGMGPWAGWGYGHGWGEHRFVNGGGGRYHGGGGAAAGRAYAAHGHEGGGHEGHAQAVHAGGERGGNAHAGGARPSAAHAAAPHAGAAHSTPHAAAAHSGGGEAHGGGGEHKKP